MRVIYVDDEKPALDNFRFVASEIKEINQLELFLKATDALAWLDTNEADIAFLDMEMAGMHGLRLAEKIKRKKRSVHIVFVTAYSQFALDAFGVEAIGYVMKPYAVETIRSEVQKAAKLKVVNEKEAVIETMPIFSLSVGERMVEFGREKPRELMAFLVDRGNAGVSASEAISYLWPDRPSDAATQSLYRVTMKRLKDVLKRYGIDSLIIGNGKKKYLDTEKVECDLYKALAGDEKIIMRYAGEYLKEYSWAESRNAQIENIKNSLEK